MKKFQFLLLALTAVAFTFIATSCGEDEEIIVVNDPPSLAFVADDANGLNAPYPTADFEIQKDEAFVYVAIEGVQGTGALQSLTVTEDGVNVDAASLSFYDLRAAADVAANNPLLITGDNTTGFTWEIGIALDGTVGTRTFAFELVDENGEVATVSIAFSTFLAEVSTTLEGVLLNQAGPAGQGGLDLDTGNSTGTVGTDPSAADAEIKDEGINNLDPSVNWKQQISAINDAVIRIPGADFPEDFKFADVTKVDEIIAFYDGGDALPNVDGTGELVSDPVAVGDIFFVNRGDTYYLLEVTEVNIVTTDNSDNIVFDVKF